MFGTLRYKIILILCLAAMMLTGCHKADYVSIHNKSNWIFDDINIPLKKGYFYKNHEKFTVDENTLGITIYFSNEPEDSWE